MTKTLVAFSLFVKELCVTNRVSVDFFV